MLTRRILESASRRSAATAAVIFAFAGLVPTVLQAQTSLAVQQANVAVRCPMTVGGSFVARSSAMIGTLSEVPLRPGEILGRLEVEIATLDTGIALRNRHLAERYLEALKGPGFERAALTDLRVPGLDPAGDAKALPFTATLELHGVTAPIAGQATVTRGSGGAIRVEAAFSVHLPDFAIDKPRHLGIGVKDQVEVEVDAVLAPAASSAPGAAS